MITLLEWIFFQTVVGIALIGAVIYGIARVLEALFPRFPNPALIALPSALLALFTVPSIPRYQFEARVLYEINGKPWLRVTNQTRWGALSEPLTWFRTPIGSVTAVVPDDATGSEGFREIVIRYDETPIVSLIDSDCTDRTILYARPDNAGDFDLDDFARLLALERALERSH